MDNLQRAGRDFLMRLVAMHGLREVARVLRALTQDLAQHVASLTTRMDATCAAASLTDAVMSVVPGVQTPFASLPGDTASR
jgi:hypothetical protein